MAAPLPELRKEALMGRKPFNAARALQLVHAGFTHREVGILLADEEGRAIPYTIQTVARGLKLLRDAAKPEN